MATANYLKQDKIPLYVYQEENDSDENYIFYEVQLEMVNHDIKLANQELKHFQIEVRHGYYQGFQLILDIPHAFDEAYQEEVRKELPVALQVLKDIAVNNGMIELRVVGRFSNGQVVYEEVK